MNQSVVPPKNHSECICIPRLQVLHEDPIIKRAEVGVGHAIVAVAGIYWCETHGPDWAVCVYHTQVLEFTQEIFSLEWDNLTLQAVYKKWLPE